MTRNDERNYWFLMVTLWAFLFLMKIHTKISIWQTYVSQEQTKYSHIFFSIYADLDEKFYIVWYFKFALNYIRM